MRTTLALRRDHEKVYDTRPAKPASRVDGLHHKVHQVAREETTLGITDRSPPIVG
jgi:hypothetical protein